MAPTSMDLRLSFQNLPTSETSRHPDPTPRTTSVCNAGIMSGTSKTSKTIDHGRFGNNIITTIRGLVVLPSKSDLAPLSHTTEDCGGQVLLTVTPFATPSSTPPSHQNLKHAATSSGLRCC
jgi:hypothetical protein